MKKTAGKTSKRTSRSRRSSREFRGLEAVLSAVIAAMKQLKARWYLFGAQAVALHGAQRTTQDVDVTALVEAPPAKIFAALRRAKLRPAFEDEAFVTQTRVIPCEHLPSGWKVDVVLGGPGFEEVIAGEAELRRVGRREIPVLRIEHLLVLKMLAGRTQDLGDVDRLVRARPDIDHREVIELLSGLERELDERDLVARYETLLSAST